MEEIRLSVYKLNMKASFIILCFVWYYVWLHCFMVGVALTMCSTQTQNYLVNYWRKLNGKETNECSEEEEENPMETQFKVNNIKRSNQMHYYGCSIKHLDNVIIEWSVNNNNNNNAMSLH